jgi:hypothetical protein
MRATERARRSPAISPSRATMRAAERARRSPAITPAGDDAGFPGPRRSRAQRIVTRRAHPVMSRVRPLMSCRSNGAVEEISLRLLMVPPQETITRLVRCHTIVKSVGTTVTNQLPLQSFHSTPGSLKPRNHQPDNGIRTYEVGSCDASQSQDGGSLCGVAAAVFGAGPPG